MANFYLLSSHDTTSTHLFRYVCFSSFCCSSSIHAADGSKFLLPLSCLSPVLFIVFSGSASMVYVYVKPYSPFRIIFAILFLHVGVLVKSIHIDSFCLNSTAASVAKSMNSIPFLRELVNLKDTCHEEYFMQQNEDEKERDSMSTPFHVVEYTGRLWFLRKTPIRFQEVITINDISPCGTLSMLECITKYRTGPNANWVDCSRVVCSISGPGPDDQSQKGIAPNLNLAVSTDLLVRLPLFGMREKVSRYISETFETAAYDFLSKGQTVQVDSNSNECVAN